MEAGIVGLSYVGKTALFNAMTALGVASTGSAAKANVGMVSIPDPRLAIINHFIETKKIFPATMQLVDVAGLAAGEGRGNRVLGHVRDVDAILHVVRCFDDPSVPHVNGSIDPVRDIEEVETELMLADLEVVENSIRNAQRKARTGEAEAKQRLELMLTCEQRLGEAKPLRTLVGHLDVVQQKLLRSFAMLTAKPVLYVANLGEADAPESAPSNAHVAAVLKYAQVNGGEAVAVCARLEAELSELGPGERDEMLEGLGLSEPALNVLARATYKLLGLQSFFTAGPKEIRAWTVPIWATGPEAAGVIHSDFQRGFIRVEVYRVEDLEEHKSEQAIKAAGKMRTEGKDYVVADGDVCHFLFNV